MADMHSLAKTWMGSRAGNKINVLAGLLVYYKGDIKTENQWGYKYAVYHWEGSGDMGNTISRTCGLWNANLYGIEHGHVSYSIKADASMALRCPYQQIGHCVPCIQY